MHQRLATGPIPVNNTPAQSIVATKMWLLKYLVRLWFQESRLSASATKLVSNKAGPILNGTVDSSSGAHHGRVIRIGPVLPGWFAGCFVSPRLVNLSRSA